MAKQKRLNTYQKSCKRIEDAGHKHCVSLFSATCIALWRYWDKRQQTIWSLLDYTGRAWKDCASDYDHSMIEMCELETGIEIQNGEGKSWRDVPYLNGRLKPEGLTYEQWVYIRQQEIKWVRPQVMACIMVSLHRKYGFGFERCSRIYQQIENIEAEFRGDYKRVRKACMELTGIDVTDLVTGKREVSA